MAAALTGALPGAATAPALGPRVSVWKSAAGSVLGLVAGGFTAAALMSLQLPDQVVVERVMLGSPVAFAVAGGVAAATWAIVAGLRVPTIVRALAIGAGAAFVVHLASIAVVVMAAALPTRDDPAGVIIAVWAATAVVGSVMGSAFFAASMMGRDLSTSSRFRVRRRQS